MTNFDLKQDIMDALDFEPSLDAASIGIAVSGGIVTLTGHVATYDEKLTAERVAMRVKGVRSMAEEIEVRPLGTHQTADDEIARRAADTLQWTVMVPQDSIRAKVTRGFVTLEGEVEWNYQREAAAKAVQSLMGVTGVFNHVRIKPHINPSDIRSRIEKALKLDAELDAALIRIDVQDGKVTLNGKVDAWSDRHAAEVAAWGAPGVTHVEDRLQVAR